MNPVVSSNRSFDEIRIEKDFTLSRRAVFATASAFAASLVLPKTAFSDTIPTDTIDAHQTYFTAQRTLECPDYSNLSPEEIAIALQKQAEYESALFIDSITARSSNEVSPKARPAYDTVYSSPVSSSTGLRVVPGQPSGGVSFNTSGSGIIISTTGGSNISISFGFPTAWGGTISLGVSFGKYLGLSGQASGVLVGIPGNGKHYKAWLNNTYSSTPYTVYYTDSYGNRSVYARMHTLPALISSDYRAKLA